MCPRPPKTVRLRRNRGFSLVEMLVVVAIIGTLVGLTLPAVQRVRESSRRTQCQANLKAMGVGITAYEGTKRTFPPGDDALTRRNHAWSSFILPFLDANPIAARIDYTKAWNAPGGNDVISDVMLGTYVCPAGTITFPGKQDYGGVLGTALASAVTGRLHPDWDHSGILYATDERHRLPVKAALVVDGLSKTLLVTEGIDRGIANTDTESQIGNSRWSCGTNCFLHNARSINTSDVDGFRSHHTAGINGLLADGRVAFLVNEIDPEVVLAMCTKDGGEVAAIDGGG